MFPYHVIVFGVLAVAWAIFVAYKQNNVEFRKKDRLTLERGSISEDEFVKLYKGIKPSCHASSEEIYDALKSLLERLRKAPFIKNVRPDDKLSDIVYMSERYISSFDNSYLWDFLLESAKKQESKEKPLRVATSMTVADAVKMILIDG